MNSSTETRSLHGEKPGIRKGKTNPKVQGHGARRRTADQNQKSTTETRRHGEKQNLSTQRNRGSRENLGQKTTSPRSRGNTRTKLKAILEKGGIRDKLKKGKSQARPLCLFLNKTARWSLWRKPQGRGWSRPGSVRAFLP